MTCRALVIGAGPAGLGAAAKLASWCDAVTVVEARPKQRLRHAGEHLPPAGIASLSDTGLENLLDDQSHDESHGVRSAWGAAEPAERDYLFTLPGRGINLCRRTFDTALSQVAEDRGAVLQFSTRLTALRAGSQGFQAVLRGPDGHQTIKSDIVIDASGRHARAARLLGGRPARFDQLAGIVGRVEGDAECQDGGTLHIEAVEQGWWYSVRCPDGGRICTYMTDAPLIRGYPGGAAALWQARLAESQIVGPLAQDGKWSGRVEVFDAATQILPDLDCDGFLAVGDAAMAYDPLSSAGIAKGLVDGHDSAKALERYHNGDSEALHAYRTSRHQSYRQYRSRHAEIYRAETRWPQSPFWRARQAQPELSHRRKEHRSC